jgi:hypothetical protein
MKIRRIVVIAIVIMIVISALALLLIHEKPHGITAMEAVELSNAPAKEWNENCELVNVGITDFTVNSTFYQNGSNGQYDKWFCVYAVRPNGSANASSITFKVFSNGTVIEQNRVEYSGIFDYGSEFISNWTIDSDEAYEIALSDVRVQEWLQKHPESRIQLFYINKMDITMWSIFWVDKSGPDSGHLSVGIVANTGEIFVTET